MKTELCAASIEAIYLAKELGIDRVELCQSLEQGGLTPSTGFIEFSLALGIETHVLIRPRSGGFRYSEDEVEIMLRDIGECKEIGANGVVIGVLDEMGFVHKKAVDMMVQKAGDMQVTFHRAFDDTLDAEKSIDQLVQLGVHRVLSSGLARNVELGMPILVEMKKHAGNRIEIMPGGGVSAANVRKLIELITPDAVHFSGTVKHLLDEESMFSETILKVDKQRIERILKEIV